MTSHRVRLAPLAAKCFEQKDPHFAFMSMALADVVELLSCRRFEIGSRYPYGLLDLGKPMKYRHASVERALCNGKTLAFQAKPHVFHVVSFHSISLFLLTKVVIWLPVVSSSFR